MRHLLLVIVLIPACQSSFTTSRDKPQSSPEAGTLIAAGEMPVPDFALTERNGQQLNKDDLHGHVWVASFVFTRCAGPCPQVTATVARIQAATTDWPDVKLVTFTVDPARDNPAELTKYAEHFRADPKRWLFLTGPEKQIHQLLMDGFKVGVERNANAKPGDEFSHSAKLVVVDQTGHIRGYFDGMNADPEKPVAIAGVVELIKQLRASPGK
jgi:cytochrome oxidase Cu insertion factor (SCO1/SenC/PrrC family)